ncbi:MAG TPA: carotenoid oxygenase family protein, partial [Myxococcota bacterium]
MPDVPDVPDVPDALEDDAPFGPHSAPYLRGPHAPVQREITVDTVHDELTIVGEVPRDLHGVYLRNGPNARFAPSGSYHPFDGDGMIHAAHIDGGHVAYRNRWVQTAGLAEEVAVGHATHSGIMTTLKGRADLRLKDSANTDVVVHRGHAIATWYMSGAPYQLDPITLATLTSSPWHGARP